MNLTTTILGGTALGGLTLALISNVKFYITKTYRLLFCNIQIQCYDSDPIYHAIVSKLLSDYTSSKIGRKFYEGTVDFIRPEQKSMLIGYEKIPEEPTIFRKKLSFILVNRSTGNNNNGPSSRSSCNISISYIRGTFDHKQFLIDAITTYNNKNHTKDWKKYNRFRIERIFGSTSNKPVYASETSAEKEKLNIETSTPLIWKKDEIGQPKKENSTNDLSLKEPILKAINDAIQWRDAEQWFLTRNIPWKQGWLLTGKPGTGKTAFTRCLGQTLNMPIFSFDLTTMENADFTHAWNDNVMSSTPCIALFEDIDAVFDGRKNITTTGLNKGLTFDCFLNTLDGVENTNGIFIIITTNNLHTIDSAIGVLDSTGMSSRPGRINRILTFDELDQIGREKMALRIFNGFDRAEWEYILNEGNNDTGAQFQERCCTKALSLWERDLLK